MQRVGHALCSSRDATALPAHGRRRANAGPHMRVPPPACRHHRESGTPRAARETRPSPLGHGRRRASAGPLMCAPPSACRDRGETCTPRAALSRATRPPSPATASGGSAPGRTCVCRYRRVAIATGPARTAQLAQRDRPPRPRRAEGQRRTAFLYAATGTSRSRRDLHAPCGSRDATALPSHSRRRASAGRTCVCNHRRVAIAARPARPVRLARRDRPPRPRPAESLRRAAHVFTAIGASQSLRDLHAPCGPRGATALPGHSRRSASAGQHMCASPSARRHCCETCTPRAAFATRPPSPATAGGGPAPGRTCVCCHWRAAVVADLHAPRSSRDATALPCHSC